MCEWLVQNFMIKKVVRLKSGFNCNVAMKCVWAAFKIDILIRLDPTILINLWNFAKVSKAMLFAGCAASLSHKVI
jgi:hypothetical protein